MSGHRCYFESSGAWRTVKNFARSDSAALLLAVLAWTVLPAETSGARITDVIPRAMQSCWQIHLLVPLAALNKDGKLPCSFLGTSVSAKSFLGFSDCLVEAKNAIGGCWVMLSGRVPTLKIQWKITFLQESFLLSFLWILCCAYIVLNGKYSTSVFSLQLKTSLVWSLFVGEWFCS